MYDTLCLDLNISRAELMHRLQKITYKTNTSFISFERDSAIPTRFEYRGMIDEHGFILKRRIRFFDNNISNPVFYGNILDQHDKICISIEIIPSKIQMFQFFFILCFFLFALFVTIIGSEWDFTFLAVASLMAIPQYFILRRGITRGKYDFERELIYISQKV